MSPGKFEILPFRWQECQSSCSHILRFRLWKWMAVASRRDLERSLQNSLRCRTLQGSIRPVQGETLGIRGAPREEPCKGWRSRCPTPTGLTLRNNHLPRGLHPELLCRIPSGSPTLIRSEIRALQCLSHSRRIQSVLCGFSIETGQAVCAESGPRRSESRLRRAG